MSSRLADPKYLKAYWPLNNHLEDVINGDDMTEVGTLPHDDGPHGRNARKTFSTSNYLSHAKSDYRIADTVGAVSAWVKVVAGAAAQVFWCSADSDLNSQNFLFIGINSSEAPIIAHRVGAGTVDEVRALSDVLIAGRWYHFIGQSKGSAYEVYIDGVLAPLSVATGSDSGAWLDALSNRDTVSIGIRHDSIPDLPWLGAVADVRYHNVTLTALEAYELFRRPVPRG